MSQSFKKALVVVVASAAVTVLIAEEAAAVIGHPATPMSVAGVARRSARREAAR